MLPPIGIVYELDFNMNFGIGHQVGKNVIHALTTSNSETIIGYRVWQLFTTEDSRAGYEEYFMNGTIFQSSMDPYTQKCVSFFSRSADCTGWLNTGILQWDNRCKLSGGEASSNSVAKMTVWVGTTDLKRPIKMNVSVIDDNSPEEMLLTFQFTSKTEGKILPNIKCDS
ncbi:unnamed protein product [Adineta steineri]|uniref:Uncharacterized protein n=1 Tax=Adineta steineri TaxID=433720 RepID=A0A814ZFR6_9BILA|nr:unnamed protein product [Adineta steineri]CAF3596246.1 unnamed protein product [Adineta steineri]